MEILRRVLGVAGEGGVPGDMVGLVEFVRVVNYAQIGVLAGRIAGVRYEAVCGKPEMRNSGL